MLKPDQPALQVLQDIHPALGGEATILFGSRARGDHRPGSDLDILVLTPAPWPDRELDAADDTATAAAAAAYPDPPKVHLVNLATLDFLDNTRYINSLATRALLDGRIITDNPERLVSAYAGPARPRPCTTGPHTRTTCAVR